MTPICHELYYMKDGVSFLVENTLFKVPRYMLENTSPVFSAMLSDVPSEAAPIRLPRVTSTDFERLLAFLYPLIPQVDAMTKSWDEQQWTSILRLATMWEMAEIRAVAMRLLSQIRDPFSKLSLGREYGHQPWVKEGFVMLCLRPEPLTAEEGVQLTKEDVIACAAAREEIRLRVLPKDQRWATGWVHPARRIRAKEDFLESMEYQRFGNNRIVRQIVNHAFSFPFDESEDEDDITDSTGDRSFWWPLQLQEITTPRIVWLTSGHDGKGEQCSGNIKELKDMADSGSIVAVADIEKHWNCSTFRRHILGYLTPLSYSAIALSVGFLILCPPIVRVF